MPDAKGFVETFDRLKRNHERAGKALAKLGVYAELARRGVPNFTEPHRLVLDPLVVCVDPETGRVARLVSRRNELANVAIAPDGTRHLLKPAIVVPEP